MSDGTGIGRHRGWLLGRAGVGRAGGAGGAGHGGGGVVAGHVVHVGVAVGVLGELARVLVGADGLQLGALAGDDLGGGAAAHVEGGHEGLADGLDVGVGDAEGGGGHADLGDEVGHLGVAQVHELVHLVHGRVGGVGVEAGHALLGAAQEGAEELVEMGEEEAGRISVSYMAKDNEGCGNRGWTKEWGHDAKK